MKKRPYGISLDPRLWEAAKQRAKMLHLSGAAYLEHLIGNDLKAGGDLTIVAEKQTSYVAHNGNLTINHAPTIPSKKKRQP